MQGEWKLRVEPNEDAAGQLVLDHNWEGTFKLGKSLRALLRAVARDSARSGAFEGRVVGPASGETLTNPAEVVLQTAVTSGRDMHDGTMTLSLDESSGAVTGRLDLSSHQLAEQAGSPRRIERGTGDVHVPCSGGRGRELGGHPDDHVGLRINRAQTMNCAHGIGSRLVALALHSSTLSGHTHHPTGRRTR